MTATSTLAPLPSLEIRSAHNPEIRYWRKLLAAVITLKMILLLFDHTPMFFLGDSVSYMNTAIGDWIPPDRSFLYGWLIRIFAVKIRSLGGLLFMQSLAGAFASVGCAFILRRYFAVSPKIAAVLGILCALEPLQLLFERYAMTESFSLLAFALFTALCLEYLRRPALAMLLLLQISGILLVSLRVSFLPLVETATPLAPLLALPALGSAPFLPRRWQQAALHLLLSGFLFFSLHTAYKHYYANLIQAQLPGAQPAYYYENGFHLLAFVAPIVQPSDFPHPEKADLIFGHLAFPLKDSQQRDKQRWEIGGLIANLRAVYPNQLEANALADQTACNALRRNPLAELPLAWKGYADYWNPYRLHSGMITDRGGDRELPDDLMILLKKHFDIDGRPLPHLVTLTNRYYFAAYPWYLLLLLLPLPAFFTLWIVPPRQRPAAFFLFVMICLQLVVIAAFSMEPTVRFLQPVAWMSILIAGIFVGQITARLAALRTPRVNPAPLPA